MKFVLLLLSLTFAVAAPLGAAAAESKTDSNAETMADHTLRLLVEQQKALLAEQAKNSPNFDQANWEDQMNHVLQGYELLLKNNPNYAAGYAAYGYFLGKVGQRRESIAILMKANQLDPNIALVKNQIGNFLAEEGRVREAVAYYLSAIKLEPNEPLYHYQLGTLLYSAQDEFVKSGEWTADGLVHSMHEAFRQAAELAPDRIEFTYRYAESFYDLTTPDWDGALKAWNTLEAKAQSDTERQTMRLHEANVLIKQGRADHARIILDTVTEPALLEQKQKLVAQLPAASEK